jgi:hypothetical protein
VRSSKYYLFLTDVLSQMQNQNERVKKTISQTEEMALSQMWKDQISGDKKQKDERELKKLLHLIKKI